MLVDRVSDYDAYWRDPQFRVKRPLLRGSLMQCYGDNIYHRHLRTREWLQANSMHSLEDGFNPINLEHDTKTTDRILLARRFVYWGGSGPAIPKRFRNFDGRDVCGGRGHQSTFSKELVQAFSDWLNGLNLQGVVGKPTDWPA